jgi:hypothetical protein
VGINEKGRKVKVDGSGFVFARGIEESDMDYLLTTASGARSRKGQEGKGHLHRQAERERFERRLGELALDEQRTRR